MSDNVEIKDFNNSSVTVAADEVTDGTLGTVQVQYTKLMDGTLNGTSKAAVDSTNSLQVSLNSLVSTANSTTSNLSASAAFTGTSEDVSNYAEVRVYVYSSHASATDGLSLQQSSDGTNWDSTDTYTISAGVAKIIGVGVSARYFRLVYTNGGTLTTSLRIQTVYHKTITKPSSQRPQDGRSNEIDVEEVASYGMIFNGSAWDRAQGLNGSTNVRIPDNSNLGSLTAAAQTVALNSMAGCSTAYVQVTGTFVATLQFEGSVDGTNYFSVNGITASSGVLVTSATATGNWQFDTSGLANFRVRCSAYTSGTATVNIRGSVGSGAVALDAPLPAGSNIIGALTANQSVNVAQINGVTPSMNNGTASTSVLRVTVASDSTGQIAAVGKAAAGATISGAPVLLGGAARTANPTAVTDGQVANVMTDKMGRQVVVQGHVRDLVGVQTTTITSSTTETTVITAGGASVFNDITSLTVTNGSATATTVTLKDATAGTTRAVYNVPGGGGFTVQFNPPMPQASANNNWTITCGTSVASIYVNTVFVKNL